MAKQKAKITWTVKRSIVAEADDWSHFEQVKNWAIEGNFEDDEEIMLNIEEHTDTQADMEATREPANITVHEDKDGLFYEHS